MAQVVKHLPGKYKALSPTPGIARKIKFLPNPFAANKYSLATILLSRLEKRAAMS
jgi:hypothetical protein